MDNKVTTVPRLIPVMEPVTVHSVYEHTPLNIYKYGEYPRYIRPVMDRTQTKTVWTKVEK